MSPPGPQSLSSTRKGPSATSMFEARTWTRRSTRFSKKPVSKWSRRVRSAGRMFGEDIMSRQRWRAGGVVLGLLLLAGPGRADEATAIEAIKKLGGRVEVDAKRPGQPVVGVDLDNTKVTDAGLKVLKQLKSLQFLDMGDNVTDAGLKELKELKHLQSLGLGYTEVTDAGLKELKELKSLQALNLRDTKITDAGLKELKELKSLQRLDLDNTKVTDVGLKELKELKSLKTLYLSVTAVTDAGLKELKELKNLQTLYLNGTKVTDTGLKELKDLKNLRTLEVAFTAVTDAGVKERKAALPKIDISH